MTGPLDGIRVVEIASSWAAWGGRALAELGADVVVVEPPGGHHTRTLGPFAGDQAHPDRSLWWWYYNASKRSVVIDLDDSPGRDRFRRLVDGVPAHLSRTDWRIEQGAPLLGQHNREVFCDLVGLSDEEFTALDQDGVF